MDIKTTVTKKEKSIVSIAVTVKNSDFMKNYEKGFNKVREVVQVDGFRKGHVPDEVILSKYGEMAILEETADLTVKETFQAAIADSKTDAIGEPTIMVTKLEKDADFEYQIEVAEIPAITLPDYFKIAKGVAKEEAKVEQKDIDEVLKEVRKMRAHKELHADGVAHDHNDVAHNQIHEDKKDLADLPELTEEYVKELGDFPSMETFMEKVKSNLALEKTQRNKEKRRNEILEKIESETKCEIPSVLTESELDRMLSQMKGDVVQMGGKFEDYLNYTKKTESDLRAEWYTDAEKRARIQLILNEIAKKENITVEEKDVKVEAKRITDMYKEADEQEAYLYMFQMMLNEKVLETIEK
jgi:trigger factor